MHSNQCHSNRMIEPMLPWDNITMAMVAIIDSETKSMAAMHCVKNLTLSESLTLCVSRPLVPEVNFFNIAQTRPWDNK